MPHALATTYLTDGIKNIPLNALSPDAWSPSDEYQQGASFSTRKAQSVVPILFRAIDMRAKAVSRLPFRLEQGGKDISENAEPQIAQIRALLYLTEAAICLTYQAYWELATNTRGRNITPEWLAVGTVTPQIDQTAQTRDKAIVTYNRTGGRGGTLPPDRVVPFWGPSANVEIGPDPRMAPAAVVLGAAGLLYDLDRYAQGFFQRGGIKMTLLTVEGQTSKEERDKLKSWWDRMTMGAKSAWRSIVVNASVTPQVIGSSPNETASPQLTKISREDIAAGMGVPMALLMLSAPLAGGTADAERLNFYDFTIVPEAEWMVGVINDKYLSRLDQAIILEPEKLEVYQWAGTQKAKAIASLTTLAPGQTILTLDEIRHLIGYAPIAETTLPDPTLPNGAEAIDEPLPAPIDQPTADLVKWQRKAKDRLKAGKSLDFSFVTDHPRADAIRAALVTATTEDEVKTAFLDPPLIPPALSCRSILVRGADALTGYTAQMRLYTKSGALLATLDSAAGAIDIDVARGRVTPLLKSDAYPDAVRCTLDLIAPDGRPIALLDGPLAEVWT